MAARSLLPLRRLNKLLTRAVMTVFNFIQFVYKHVVFPTILQFLLRSCVNAYHENYFLAIEFVLSQICCI